MAEKTSKVEFGEETAEDQGNVQTLAVSREKYRQPLHDEQRSMLYTLMATFLQSGLDLATASRLIAVEGSSQMALAAEAFFVPLLDIKENPTDDYRERMDQIIKDAFGRRHVEPTENVVLQAMAVAPNILPLLLTAAQISGQTNGYRRDSVDVGQVEDIRKKA
jgi:hypothetical protein